ncbi:aminotransferase class I/II-fold pyridoxal phosphate-dependent enzyme [Rhodobacter sphaeroides]|jgi:transcriptional regulator, GntR family|uniref:Transcriptional regulator, GntR family n=2 Tax=Cereibacter sphaeroides TaxID=1063 RepID=Q3IVI7_CERS4|nr:PLP-dependent aminotransferase family protein [Cereibacter sphaeroides]ABA81447.1 transcriptional regulator, GntR family [Cereibacter sphaeroides 2.4.1]AMJ50006.1 GntR family transcriptional regulator [Cereibacter sphaeroides]ANS36814.1 GntR family transcriptional regulator [Cereibacter sphaeroides]ATN65793.1 GntR family transcriptional regulator [Cereibacter sphaeroides]AXC63946.1 PLP-dependent aminotransferase family protein [Cereibacter sphaeroides 2.4.1]
MQSRIPIEAIFLRDDAPTLQGRLAAAVVRAILESRARPGARLPSSRRLAQGLGVSRMTVTLVYQDLISQGYLEALPRSGIAVAATVPHRRMEPVAGARTRAGLVRWEDWWAEHDQPRRVIRKPSNWRAFRYPFIFGQVDPALFDHHAWRDCARRALGTRDFSDLAADRYGADDPLLVDYICSNTLPRRGFQAEPDEVLVTLGAQNALYLAVELLARIDRLAVTEEPGYPDFAETLRRASSPIHFLPVDAMGLDPARLPEATRLVIATPSHHIPTGATMPLARRQELLRRAEELDALIIEDDYDFEMSYLAPPAPALKSLDGSGRVIYIGSFSKSLFPGLRIGYMVAPAPFIARARALRAMILRHPPSHLQRITAYFLALGHYDAHIVRLRQTLKARRRVLEEALAASSLRIEGAAVQGGSSVWVSAEGTDSEALAARLHADSVLIEPGSVFFETPPARCPVFRLGYATISAERIPEGIALIDRAARERA